MADPPQAPERFSLSRWSRRKLAAAREAQPEAVVAPAPLPLPAAVVPAIEAPVAAPVPDAADALPAVETLTFESDFAPYLQPKVGEDTKRAALKKLFSDPRFNVMDGLDTYIDDYTRADPMPAGMLDKLANVYGMLKDDPPPAEAPPTAGEPIAPAAPEDAEAPAPVATASPQPDDTVPPPTVDSAAPVTEDELPVTETRTK